MFIYQMDKFSRVFCPVSSFNDVLESYVTRIGISVNRHLIFNLGSFGYSYFFMKLSVTIPKICKVTINDLAYILNHFLPLQGNGFCNTNIVAYEIRRSGSTVDRVDENFDSLLLILFQIHQPGQSIDLRNDFFFACCIWINLTVLHLFLF